MPVGQTVQMYEFEYADSKGQHFRCYHRHEYEDQPQTYEYNLFGHVTSLLYPNIILPCTGNYSTDVNFESMESSLIDLLANQDHFLRPFEGAGPETIQMGAAGYDASQPGIVIHENCVKSLCYRYAVTKNAAMVEIGFGIAI